MTTLTIGMATYDDYDGVYFTIQAIRLNHPEIAGEIEFIVVDNHPDGPCAAELKSVAELDSGLSLHTFHPGAGYCGSRRGVSRSESGFRALRGLSRDVCSRFAPQIAGLLRGAP